MSRCWLALIAAPASDADGPGRGPRCRRDPAGWLAAWLQRAKPVRTARRVDHRIVDPDGAPAWISLVLAAGRRTAGLRRPRRPTCAPPRARRPASGCRVHADARRIALRRRRSPSRAAPASPGSRMTRSHGSSRRGSCASVPASSGVSGRARRPDDRALRQRQPVAVGSLRPRCARRIVSVERPQRDSDVVGRPLQAEFAPSLGMAGVSLRHRGDELLDRQAGLLAYARTGAVMGVPLLYPWANRLADTTTRSTGTTSACPPGRRSCIARTRAPDPRPAARIAALADDRTRRDQQIAARLDFDAHPELLVSLPVPTRAGHRGVAVGRAAAHHDDDPADEHYSGTDRVRLPSRTCGCPASPAPPGT